MTRTAAAADDPGANVTLAEFLEFVFIPQRLAQSKPRTVGKYRVVVKAFRQRFGASVRMADITLAMLAAFEQGRIDAGHAAWAPRYRSMIVSLLMAWHAQYNGGACEFQHKPSVPGPGRPKAAEKPVEPGTLWWLYKTSYRPKKLRGGSSKTDHQFRIQLNHLARYLGREAVLTDLNEDTICAFLDVFAQTHAARTVNKALYSLRALWEHAARRRLVPDFPTLVATKEPRRIPRAWTVAELARLFDACRQESGSIDGIPAGDWWHALHVVAWGTGERIGALLATRLADVDFEGGAVLIPAEARKAKRLDMLYKLLPETLEALAKIRQPDRELLFPWPRCIETFYHAYKRILKRAGLPTDRSCKPQKIRRSFASYVEAAGGNATAALAHSSRGVTMRSYLDPRICGGQNPADLLPPIPPPPKNDEGGQAA